MLPLTFAPLLQMFHSIFSPKIFGCDPCIEFFLNSSPTTSLPPPLYIFGIVVLLGPYPIMLLVGPRKTWIPFFANEHAPIPRYQLVNVSSTKENTKSELLQSLFKCLKAPSDANKIMYPLEFKDTILSSSQHLSVHFVYNTYGPY